METAFPTKFPPGVALNCGGAKPKRANCPDTCRHPEIIIILYLGAIFLGSRSLHDLKQLLLLTPSTQSSSSSFPQHLLFQNSSSTFGVGLEPCRRGSEDSLFSTLRICWLQSMMADSVACTRDLLISPELQKTEHEGHLAFHLSISIAQLDPPQWAAGFYSYSPQIHLPKPQNHTHKGDYLQGQLERR